MKNGLFKKIILILIAVLGVSLIASYVSNKDNDVTINDSFNEKDYGPFKAGDKLHFYLDGISYNFEVGMTFETFIASEYNRNNRFYESSGYIYKGVTGSGNVVYAEKIDYDDEELDSLYRGSYIIPYCNYSTIKGEDNEVVINKISYFYFNGEKVEFEHGMNFKQFVDSEYNVHGFICDDTYILLNVNGVLRRLAIDGKVNPIGKTENILSFVNFVLVD